MMMKYWALCPTEWSLPYSVPSITLEFILEPRIHYRGLLEKCSDVFHPAVIKQHTVHQLLPRGGPNRLLSRRFFAVEDQAMMNLTYLWRQRGLRWTEFSQFCTNSSAFLQSSLLALSSHINHLNMHYCQDNFFSWISSNQPLQNVNYLFFPILFLSLVSIVAAWMAGYWSMNCSAITYTVLTSRMTACCGTF